MSQQMTAVGWNPLVGNASTAVATNNFVSPIAQWRLANRSANTLYVDFSSGATPSTGTGGMWLESSGVMTGQGAIIQNLSLWTSSTGAGGMQAIFNGFII
jgi:hypothetical protein